MLKGTCPDLARRPATIAPPRCHVGGSMLNTESHPLVYKSQKVTKPHLLHLWGMPMMRLEPLVKLVDGSQGPVPAGQAEWRPTSGGEDVEHRRPDRGAWQIWSLNTTANRRRLDAGSPPPDPFRERYPFLTGSAGAVSELRRTAGKGEREDGEGKSHCYPVLAVESDVSKPRALRRRTDK